MSFLSTLTLRMTWLFCLSLAAAATSAIAAEVNHETFQDTLNGKQRSVLVLRGQIVSGDLNRLLDRIPKPHPANGKRSAALYIDSPGGDVAEAMKIGELIREIGFGVFVMPQGTCASACFFVYLNGSPRVAKGWNPRNKSNTENVGLHRPYLKAPKNDGQTFDAQLNVMQKVGQYLEGKSVPRRLVDAMMSRPSNDIYWLTNSDLDDLGDYRPEIEELFIAKCKYDRRDHVEEFDAIRYGDQNRLKAIQAKLDRVSECTSALRADTLNRGWAKLERGWIPPNPLESNDQRSQPSTSIAQREQLVESAHPGWTILVKTGAFRRWLQAQSTDIVRLSNSDDSQDAIKLLSRYKADIASGN